MHSGKFRNEKDSSKVREAVLRYEVKNAVINDNKILLEGIGKVKNDEKIEFDFEPMDKVMSDLNNLHAE